ncbi:MAG: phenylalanine--tRNA ligase subunit beta [Planctomycetota bacterium]
MKISLQWLNTYLDTPVDAGEAERLLTGGGFPIEDREPLEDGDVRLDVEVTSNRPDVLSHIGVAREIAARSDRVMQITEPELAETGRAVEELASVVNDAPDLCPLYTARVITGVKVAPSPAWLKTAVENAGLRSVNNVVDVTNFVLLETGQPLHAFDLNLLQGKQILVRRASSGEAFTAIDHTEHKLERDMLVIADRDRPVALAGVMGGADSEVGDATTDLLIESAMFEPLSVRRASRRLKLASDSSFRFERGIDPLGVDRASRRCCELILDVAGGTLADGVIRVGQDDPEPTTIALRCQRTRDLLGIELSAQEQAVYLQRLSIACVIDGETLRATIPTYRLDLVREIDLIEEIARQHGLQRIPLNQKISITAHHPQPSVLAKRRLIEVLVAHGYHETITPSLIPLKDSAACLSPDGDARPASLYGEVRRADNTLRPGLLPSLLACRKLNQDAGNQGVKLFEIASGWVKQDEQITEKRQLTLLADADDGQATLRAMRGAIEEMIHALGGESTLQSLTVVPEQIDGYATAGLVHCNKTPVGHFGVLDEALAESFGLQATVAAAELDVEHLIALYPPTHTAGELPKYPAIERDISVVVDEATPWRKIAEGIDAAKPELFESVRFVGTYRGKQVGKGKKSVTFRLQFRDPERTLRHDQVDPQVEAVVKALGSSVSAELRG